MMMQWGSWKKERLTIREVLNLILNELKDTEILDRPLIHNQDERTSIHMIYKEATDPGDSEFTAYKLMYADGNEPA